MKQKHLARLAALLAGVTGGVAFGHDHLPPVDCSQYPWWCRPYCYELNACRAGNTPIGGSDCWNEENNLAFCELRVPFVPPVPPVVAPPFVPPVFVPPPDCPAGQLRQGGACVPCGRGQVPNDTGTACVAGDTSYHAGKCPRNLGGLPFRVGTVRHDDVAFRVMEGEIVDEESLSGFFTSVSMITTVLRALRPGTHPVAGHHTHGPGTCEEKLPQVSRSEYEALKRRAKKVVWNDYDLFDCNCQHWAIHVVDGTDVRPEECD